VQITGRLDYALRAMVTLARVEQPVTVGKLAADSGNLSVNYLYVLLDELRRGALVHIQRGPNGGVVLAQPASRLTVKDVVQAMEGAVAFSDEPTDADSEKALGHFSTVWLAAHNAMLDALAQVTLADLAADRIPKAIEHLAKSGRMEGAQPSFLPQNRANRPESIKPDDMRRHRTRPIRQ
jgi:Rrf2 family protein